MKIACQSCGAKYTIADEKVSGKTVKIKCKKCGATVVVDGHAQADGGQGYGNEAAGADEWTVSVADDDQRTLTTPQIVEEYRNGVVTPDTFVWREGMAEWQALGEVAELASLCGGAAQAAEPAPQPFAAAQGGGYAMAASPAPAAAAVRKRGQSVDLFGSGGGGGGMEAAPAPGVGNSAHIGERNENSVLFSLSALTAAESAAKKGGGGGAPKPGPRAPGAPAPRAAPSMDDIMSLGSGRISPGAALAPPPINAPFIEPPAPAPPPPSFSPAQMQGPASGYGPQGGMGMPMGMGAAGAYPGMEQPKKSPVGLIVGGVVALAAILGVVFVLTRGGGEPAKDPVAKNDTASSKPEAKADKADSKEDPAPDAAKADTTAAPSDTATPSGSAVAAAPPTAAPNGAAPTPAAGGPLPPNTGKAGPKEGTKKEDPKTEDPKKEEPPASGGTGSFDRGAAQAALGGAAGSAKGCKKDGGPTGSTKVQVTFAPSGRVTTVNVGAPFAGTPVGSCIAGAFKGASVPPFSGSPVTVSKSVSIK